MAIHDAQEGALRSGTIIGDRFSIRGLAGEGGMGSVYRAEELSTGKTAAIKILHSRGSADRARFLREAQVLSSLSYPSIVACLGHGALPTGDPWMAMEWVEGEDLATRLERGPLPPHEALVIVRAIAAALGAAHDQGIVHRDVKPGNIILECGNPARARLIDFGVARLRSAHSFTEYGTLLGTPAYMAPEQIRGASDADGRADLYALGVILFECVTGQPPFQSSSIIGVMTQALFEPPPRLRDINPALSPALDALVHALLEKDPMRRLGPASVLLEALKAPDLDRFVSHPPPRMPSVALTEDELRFVSVVFVECQPLSSPNNWGFGSPSAPFAPNPNVSTTSDTVMDRSEGQLLQSIERIALSHHGRVEGLLDGTVLVAFHARGTATDQAAVAARTALAVRDLGTGRPIALATGRASANVGSLYSDAATRAASLTSFCISQETAIAIDETTRGLLDARFSVEQRQGTSFLLAEDPFGEAGRLLCGRPAPFVGREREVALIEKIFDDVVHEPQGAAVVVMGEAGAGKSRLGRETLAALSRVEPQTEIWVARGEAVRAGGSFGMLVNALQRAAGIREGEAREVRHQKLAAFIKERVKPDKAPAIITFLGEIAETGKEIDSDELRAARRDPALMRDRIRFAFEDLVDAITDKHPLVLLLEDLHWGDVPTVKVLEMASRRLRAKPFFILALGRPEIMDMFPKLFTDWSPSTMRLSGLSRRACQQLIHRILGEHVDSAIIASIVQRSAGHPLFLEELVRAVGETTASGTKALPETVLAMVQSRVAKLPAEARRVLRAASVFGEVFWQEGVAALLGSTDTGSDVESWLDMLRNHEFVEAKRTSSFPSQHEYSFRHALFREAAYAMLTDADKATGHLLAGRFLEKLGETNARLLAAHFDEAREPLRAAPYHARAAREAMLGGDLDVVLMHADCVIESGGNRTLLGEALTVKADALQWRGAYEQAGQVAEQAIAKLNPGCALWFGALTTLAMVATRRIQLDKLREVSNVLTTWGAQNEWTDAYIEAAIRIGLQAHIGGQYQLALDLMTPLTKLTRDASPRKPRTQALFEVLAAAQTTIAWRYDRTLQHLSEAARLFEQIGDHRTAAGQRLDSTFTLVDIGQADKAIEICKELLDVAHRFAIPRLRSITMGIFGAALLAQGRYDAALDLLLESKTLFDALGDARNGGSVRYKIGRCYRLRKEFERAAAYFDEAETMLAEFPRTRVICHANKALLYVDLGKAADALADASKGMQIFEQLGRIGTDEILVRYAYIESLLLNGRIEDAATELATAKERVQWIANRFTDETARRLFLANVDENRKVLEMQCA